MRKIAQRAMIPYMSTENVVPLPERRPAFVPAWTFADRLRKARLTTGLGGREFAQQLGCTYSAYAQWEAGNSKPRDLVPMAQQVQAVTGVAAAWLVGIEPEDTKMAPTANGEGHMLPEMDSNHQPAGIKPEGAEIIAFPAREAATDDDSTERVAPVTALFA